MLTAQMQDRIAGCLAGAAIGDQLGFAKHMEPQRFAVAQPGEILGLKLEPLTEWREEPSRIYWRKAAPFINLGVQAYLAKNGRATPEDFARLLRDDRDISGPVFGWDCVHTIQEILKEGMNPRISGLGTAPCGLIAAAMPAVGIYHLGDPEYAYLDGVELASVAQPRLGADWAALCAAAVAASLAPDADSEAVVDAVLKIAHRNNKDLFYHLNQPTRQADWTRGASEEAFLEWWHRYGGRPEGGKETNWISYNPIRFVLPLVKHYARAPQRLMALLLAPPNTGAHIAAVIGGALAGALCGLAALPAEWRKWAEPVAEPWLPLAQVVERRLEHEREIISVTEHMAAPPQDGDSLLHDKIYGCLLAGAIGNAMGSPVEGKHFREIDEQHPGGIKTVLDPRRLEGEDDNQMAMLLVETYLERDGLPVMARHFGDTWKQRLNRDHFYPLCMGNAYDLICRGWDARITGHWSVVTGSTVMCMEPVGIFHAADPAFAAIDATAISYMYQRGLDVAAATMLAATVAEAMRPDATVDSVLQAALDRAPRQPMRTFDERQFASPYHYLQTCLEVAARYDDVLAARAELYEKCLFYGMIDPLELWGLSLAMFKIAHGDVRQAAIGGTNIGRDSDTISGRAAMLSGALRGAKSVPADWVALFKPQTLERIRANAARLADLVLRARKNRLQARQAALAAPE